MEGVSNSSKSSSSFICNPPDFSCILFWYFKFTSASSQGCSVDHAESGVWNISGQTWACFQLQRHNIGLRLWSLFDRNLGLVSDVTCWCPGIDTWLSSLKVSGSERLVRFYSCNEHDWCELVHLEGAHEGLINGHHASSIVKLPAVVWGRKEGHLDKSMNKLISWKCFKPISIEDSPVDAWQRTRSHLPPPEWRRLKNDRRNSGGTHRQKFNLIDIWYLTFEIWTFEHLIIWTFERLNIWTFEHNRTFEDLNIWTFEHLSIWIIEHLNVGTFEHWIWTFEHLTFNQHQSPSVSISQLQSTYQSASINISNWLGN